MMDVGYVCLAVAILAEVVATTALKSSDGFTRPWPSVVSVFGYGLAFWLLSRTLRTMPTGLVYALWSGVGVVLIAVMGRVVHGQTLDAPAMIGLGLITAGVIVINVFSHSVGH